MKLKNWLLESALVHLLLKAAEDHGDDLTTFFARCGDVLNDRIEGTRTQADDILKQKLANAIEQGFLPQLRVEGVDGPVAVAAADAPPAAG